MCEICAIAGGLLAGGNSQHWSRGGCFGYAGTVQRTSDGEVTAVNLWFWAWVVLAIIFAIAESVNGSLLVLPWAFGAAAAAVLDAMGAPIAWQWITFLVLSSALLVAGQRLIIQRRK